MSIKNTSYLTLSQKSEAEFKDKGSKFIGIAFPVESKDEFESILSQIRIDYPKATHYCYAYKIGHDGNNFRINDDGEPSGSAGKPVFGQIESNKLSNAAIVVVRYYGGTKLGVPGLINAYKNASALAIVENTIEERMFVKKFKVIFNPSQYEQMQVCIGQLKKISREVKFNSDLEITVTMTLDEVDKLNKTVFESIFGYGYELSSQHLLDEIIFEQL